MKKLFLFLLVAALTSACAFAQDASSNEKSKADVRTITGCLSQGHNAKEFMLKADDGSTWELRSSSVVDLTSHVGQEVKITGAVKDAKMHNLKEDAKDAATDTGMKKNNAEHGHLEPTDLQMINSTCSQ